MYFLKDVAFISTFSKVPYSHLAIKKLPNIFKNLPALIVKRFLDGYLMVGNALYYF